jgi:NAD(P)H-hydrate epimerase
MHEQTAMATAQLLQACDIPCVIDADALNLVAKHQLPVPKGSVLTPHPKEFERLFGTTANSFARLDLLRETAVALHCVIVLKGAHTCVALPDGSCHFNSTGNPGMAKGGSGDVLTGIIVSLLAQGYSPAQAALAGVYLHGAAGDLAAMQLGEAAMLPSDIIGKLGEVR